MNRRHVLQSAGVVSLGALAGCLDGVREHFTGSISTNAPIEIYSAAERSYNIALEGIDPESGRQTYDQSFSVNPNERVIPQTAARNGQLFRVTRFGHDDLSGRPGEDLVEQGTVERDTQQIDIHITDDDLTLTISRSETETNSSADGEERTDDENASSE